MRLYDGIAFKERYNHQWCLEKPDFMSPLEAHQAYALQKTAWVAIV